MPPAARASQPEPFEVDTVNAGEHVAFVARFGKMPALTSIAKEHSRFHSEPGGTRLREHNAQPQPILIEPE